MGSVKDLLVTTPAHENRTGVGTFIFSDRYSVFDWGEMPDHIQNKGCALAVMAAYNFEELEKRSIPTHYQGLVQQNGGIVRFAELKQKDCGARRMQVSLARVYHPIAREFWVSERDVELRYDYSFFEKNRGRINNYLIGLEIIFRNGLPLGSSVFKKIDTAQMISDTKERQKKLASLLKGLGLKERPQPGDMLPAPVMGFTTKLEPGDRSLTEKEAYRISGLRKVDFQELKQLALKVNDFVTERAEETGFQHYDGKVEMLYNNRLYICDVLGTFDENRFGFQGQQISKEVLRQWYKRNQPAFVEACDRWKKTGAGWQKRSDVQPVKLPPTLATMVSQIYMAGCNRYTGKKVFDVPELERVLEKLQRYKDQQV